MTQVEFDLEMARLRTQRAEAIDMAEKEYFADRKKQIQLFTDTDKALRDRLTSAETMREELQKTLDEIVMETGNKDCTRGIKQMALIREQKMLETTIRREREALKRDHYITLQELTRGFHHLCRAANSEWDLAKLRLTEKRRKTECVEEA